MDTTFLQYFSNKTQVLGAFVSKNAKQKNVSILHIQAPKLSTLVKIKMCKFAKLLFIM